MYTDIQAKAEQQLRQAGIIPVLALEDVESGLKLIEVLSGAGLRALEITYRTKAAPDVIKEAKKRFPHMLLGAGTVLNLDHLKQAIDLGASFAVAPGFNPTIVKAAIEKNFAFCPGIVTPSEVEQAYELGIRMFKFFPAEAAGGIPMIKSIIAPYKHLGIAFMPTGGVTPKNAPDYLAIPQIACVGGTWLGKSEDIKAGNWAKIEADAKASMDMLKQCRG